MQMMAQQQPPGQPQPEPQPPQPPGVDLPLRQKYASTRAVARAAPLVAPDPSRALTPEAQRWFDSMRIPEDLLRAAGVGMASVLHPVTKQQVDAVALPYRHAGRIVDVRYWIPPGLESSSEQPPSARPGPAEQWLAHGGWHLYGLEPVERLGGDVVFAGSELDVLALAAAGIPGALAVPQQLPSWHRDRPAYHDARLRVQPLREHLERLHRRQEEAQAAADGAKGSLAESLGFGKGPDTSGGGAQQQGPRQRSQGQQGKRKGAAAAAASQGMGLLLPNATSAVLAFDATPEDEALAAELASLLGTARCRGVYWPRNWDEHLEPPRDELEAWGDGARFGVRHVLSRDGAQVLKLYLSQAYTWPIEGIERFGDYISLLEAAFDGQLEQHHAHSTGWPSVDELFKATPGELTLVTGVPNSGKSEWLDALAVNLARLHGWRFALCSLEKRPRDHGRQLVEKIAGKPMLKAAYAGDVPRMTPQELEDAFAWLDEHFVVIHSNDDAMPTLEWVLEKARAAAVKYGVKGLILDPYNELDHSRPAGKNEHEYISEFMARLRQFAKSNACHVFLVAHPKQRANWHGEAPNLMDISGGANFFAKCDNGIVVHRDWSQLKELRETTKHRGPGGARNAGTASGGGSSSGSSSPGGGSGTHSPCAAAADGGGQQQQQQQQPFLGYCVEIQVQKVRNKNTGSRGVAFLEYDPASGRYYELGEVPPRSAAAQAGAAATAAGGGAVEGRGVEQAPSMAAGVGHGDGGYYAREGEYLVEAEEVEEDDVRLFAELRQQDELKRHTERQIEVYDYTQRRVEEDIPEWLEDRD